MHARTDTADRLYQWGMPDPQLLTNNNVRLGGSGPVRLQNRMGAGTSPPAVSAQNMCHLSAPHFQHLSMVALVAHWLLCCRGAPRVPAIDVRANRLAGTAFGAIGLPGAALPPLAVRKLQRAKVQLPDSAPISDLLVVFSSQKHRTLLLVRTCKEIEAHDLLAR